MKANLGGTFIFDILAEVLKKPVIHNYVKQIFLLTDGGVANSN